MQPIMDLFSYIVCRSGSTLSESSPSHPPPQTPAPTAESTLAFASLELTGAPSSTEKRSLSNLSNNAPPTITGSPQPPRTVEEDDEPMSSIMRFLTGIVVTGAAGVLLLQLLPSFATPPLMADEHTHLNCPSSSDADFHTEAGQPIVSGTAFRRTVSWLRTLSFGASSGHSRHEDGARSIGRILQVNSKRGSGRSLRHETPDPNGVCGGNGVNHNCSPGTSSHAMLHGRALAHSYDSLPGCDSPVLGSPTGVCHAVSAGDLAQVGAPVGGGTPGGNNSTPPGSTRASTHILGSWEAPAVHRSLSPLHSQGARATAPDVLAAGPHKNVQSSLHSSRPPLHKRYMEPSASCGVLPVSGAAASADEMGGATAGRRKVVRVESGLALSRRSRKRTDHCNIKGCLYRPWSMLTAAMFHSTAEFHHCSRCQSDFCLNHMAWVTHEKALMSKCPLDARCICELCWIELRRHGKPVPSIGTTLLL